MTKARGRFKVESGGEDSYEMLDNGVRLTHAQGTQKFTGDIKGDGAVHWLMAYRGDKTATFVGMQRISGTIGGRRGSVVLAAEGVHDGKGSRIKLTVVPGSASGELEGLSGKGKLEHPGAKTGTYELEYALPGKTPRRT
jgi:hypothetical protein